MLEACIYCGQLDHGYGACPNVGNVLGKSTSPPTLRQRYAMAALTGLLSNTTHSGDADAYGRDAWRYADALIAAERQPAEGRT